MVVQVLGPSGFGWRFWFPPLVMYTEGAAGTGQSEVDGFAEGGGQVRFPEGLRHRLEEEEEEEEFLVFVFIKIIIFIIISYYV